MGEYDFAFFASEFNVALVIGLLGVSISVRDQLDDASSKCLNDQYFR